MKKFFAGLGVIFVIIVVLGAIGFWYIAARGNALDKESKAYADAAIPAIVTNWNEQALFDRATVEFNEAARKQHLDQGFRWFRWFGTLGRLQKCEPAQGKATMSVTTLMDNKITAQYTAKATFEKGQATITVDLVKRGDQWWISRFGAYSPQLAPK
jgi:hypothetical protein